MGMKVTEAQGIITSDPESRVFSSGKTLVTFSFGISNNYKKDGEWVNQTPIWVTVNAWEGVGEDALSYQKKDIVTIDGRLEQDEYVSQKTGETVFRLKLTADSITQAGKTAKRNPGAKGNPSKKDTPPKKDDDDDFFAGFENDIDREEEDSDVPF